MSDRTPEERPEAQKTEKDYFTSAEEVNEQYDDGESRIPGVVPPEGHAIHASDDPATAIHEEQLTDYQEDIGVESISDTQHSDGSTANPEQASEQGLVYEPPTDPPVVPSDDKQGAEIGAGFAPSMEASNPGSVDLPDRVDGNDLDLEEDVDEALRLNSETRHLTGLEVQVRDKIATVRGIVPSEDDLGRAERVIRDLDGIHAVVSQETVATDR